MVRWLDTVEANAEVKPGTIARYRQIVAQYIEPRDIGSVPLGRLTPTHIIDLYADLERCSDATCNHKEPARCTGLSPATRQLIHAVSVVRSTMPYATRIVRATPQPESGRHVRRLPA